MRISLQIVGFLIEILKTLMTNASKFASLCPKHNGLRDQSKDICSLYLGIRIYIRPRLFRNTLRLQYYSNIFFKILKARLDQS